MECVSVTTEVLLPQKKHVNKQRSGYEVDFWHEMRKRWLVFGVLVTMLAAVVSPRLGASGGSLHTQYLRYIPLVHIYYASGRRARQAAPRGGFPSLFAPRGGRAAALTVLHSHIAAPALCLTLLSHTNTHPTILKGALLSSVGAGCGWVSLALCPQGAALATAALSALNYSTSILATPLLKFIICGRATIPPLGGIVSSILISLTPFVIGVLTEHNTVAANNRVASNNRVDSNNRVASNNRAMKVSALLLLYTDCCDLLREAEGSLYVGDVLYTLMLVVTWVCASAGWCCGYGRAGLVAAPQAALVPLVAVPKCLDPGWESSASCPATGLARLPAALLAPAQTLLLAAIFTDDDTYHNYNALTNDDTH